MEIFFCGKLVFVPEVLWDWRSSFGCWFPRENENPEKNTETRPPVRRLFGVAGPPSGADRDEADSGGRLVRRSLLTPPRMETSERTVEDGQITTKTKRRRKETMVSLLDKNDAKPFSLDRCRLCQVTTPKPTLIWTPLPLSRLMDSVEGQLRNRGYRVHDSTSLLSHGGDRFFGTVSISNRENLGYRRMIGARNSHASFRSGNGTTDESSATRSMNRMIEELTIWSSVR
jgi:hypothetical protein